MVGRGEEREGGEEIDREASFAQFHGAVRGFHAGQGCLRDEVNEEDWMNVTDEDTEAELWRLVEGWMEFLMWISAGGASVRGGG